MRPDNTATHPEVLHIGFSKCASTFLQAFFTEHPEVFLVNQSHYLAPFDFSPYPEGRDAYRQLFDGAATGQLTLESDEHIVLPLFHPVLGAAATTLDSVREVAARIKAIQPDARIIVVIRNQTSMMASRYSEFVICGGKHDFPEFVAEFLQCSEDGVNYFQNYYFQILKILQAEFSETNVLMLLQEDLAASESTTIERLSRFLGIEPRRPGQRGMASRRVGLSNLGIRMMLKFNRLMVTRQKQSFHEAQVRGPFLLYKVLQRGFRTLDFYLPERIKGDKNAILDKTTRQRIRRTFEDDNAALGEYLKRDLSGLGY